MKKLKEIIKVKNLKKSTEEELKQDLKNFRDAQLMYALQSIIKSNIFEVHCDFLDRVARRSELKYEWNKNSLYKLLVDEKGMEPFYLDLDPFTLYVVRYRGKLLNIKNKYLNQYPFKSDNGKNYTYINNIEFKKVHK